MILIDKREPESIKRSIMSACELAGITYEVLLLKFADFVISPERADAPLIGIERKTVSDMVGSLASGRLETQLTGVKESYDYCYLLVEGDLTYNRVEGKLLLSVRGMQTKWPFLTIHNFLAGLHLRGMSWQHTGSLSESVTWMLGFHEMLTKGPVERIPASSKKAREQPSPALSILCAIPGIGPKAAKALLARFHSVAALSMSDDSIIQSVDGIGPSALTKIRSALGRVECNAGSNTTGSDSPPSSSQQPSSTSAHYQTRTSRSSKPGSVSSKDS